MINFLLSLKSVSGGMPNVIGFVIICVGVKDSDFSGSVSKQEYL